MKRKECAYVQAVIQLKLRLHFLSFCLEIFSLLYSLFIVIVGILQIPWKGRWIQIQQNRHANPTNSFFQLSFLSMLSFKAEFIKRFKQRPVMSDRFQNLKVSNCPEFSSIFIGTLKAIFYCHFPGLFMKFDVTCIFNSMTLGQK